MGSRYEEIAKELAERADVDQSMRLGKIPWDPEIDRRNTEWLKTIVGEIGWPTRSKVGEQASILAWLIAQHAAHDVAFQEHALALMRSAGDEECRPRDVAYLEDRVRVNHGLPQLYGTQGWVIDDVWQPREIEREEEVDERRKMVGLSTLAEYEALMRQSLQDQKKEPTGAEER